MLISTDYTVVMKIFNTTSAAMLNILYCVETSSRTIGCSMYLQLDT